MKPTFLAGDLVNVALHHFNDKMVFGVVIAVRPANHIPDADIRGLTIGAPWNYWIMSNQRIYGPLSIDQLSGVSELTKLS